DYNQVMYRLDLSDRRLALPVAIYEIPSGDGTLRLATRAGRPETGEDPPRRIAFFAPDRPGLAGVPVFEESDPHGGHVLRVGAGRTTTDDRSQAPLFYMLPDDSGAPDERTVRLYEHRDETAGKLSYSVDLPGRRSRAAGQARVMGRVWPNPAPALRW